MAAKEKVFAPKSEETVAEKPAKKEEQWVHTICPVVGKDARFGFVSFLLDGTFFQGVTKKVDAIKDTVAIKHNGKEGKDFKWDFDL